SGGSGGGCGGCGDKAESRVEGRGSRDESQTMLRIREDRQRLARRIEVSRVAVGAVLSLLAIAYWFVQIARGDYYFSLSENNRIRAVKVTAPRGYVLDR